MSKRNFKKSLLEKGGLMIEALAMLGLIAVVTPTMYKKSAERTMEVQDINTASTIRTVMRAADAYTAANYTYIVSDMEANNQEVRNLPFSDLEHYLPYKFDIDKALYNYNAPELTIRRQDNNLTVFALFPAKVAAEEGIGQERTSRIAALIGANGGFMNDSQKARGVGGIWKLEGNDFTTTFPNHTGANTHSIVTSSSESINNFTSGELDNDKYLQRGKDDGESGEEYNWKNTMWTDLYLGDDVIPNDDVYLNVDGNTSGHHSIRNIYSLIVGTNKAPENTDYGLYIANEHTDSSGTTTDNPAKNAYIAGSLEAVLRTDGEVSHVMFKVDEDNMGYGNIFKLADNAEHRGFEVDGLTGNTLIGGSLSNYGNLNLSALGSQQNPDGWNSIKIGQINSEGDNINYAVQASRDNANSTGSVSLINENVFKASKGSYADSKGGDSGETEKIKMMTDGYHQINNNGAKSDAPEPSYISAQIYPVEVGSNMYVRGLLTAGQIDAQKLRTAEFSSGSENIDDDYQWFKVDADGVVIADPADREETAAKTHAVIDSAAINLYAGTKTSLDNTSRSGDSSAMLRLQDAGSALFSADKTVIQAGVKENPFENEADVSSGELRLESTNITAKMLDDDLVISSTGNTGTDAENTDITTTFDSGFVNMRNTDLAVVDKDNNSVFTVKANETENVDYADAGTGRTTGDYQIAAHGNVLFTDSTGGSATDRTKSYTYLSLGEMSDTAAVNIVPYDNNNSPSDSAKNIVYIDQGATYNSSVDSRKERTAAGEGYNGVGEGTIYMRKGFLEVNPSETPSGDLSADQGYGVVKASRFVANNPEAEGMVVRPTDAALAGYGTSDNKALVPYDTFMVNPAYTSVMKDIKLTTRGGARLSDILPDFINKGIYLVSNTAPESKGSQVIQKLGSDPKTPATLSVSELNDYGGTAWLAAGTSTNMEEADYAASPLVGFARAPQCPPGYMQVMTLAPASFMSAMAGKISQGSAGTSRPFVVPSDLHSDSSLVMPNYYQVGVKFNGNASAQGTLYDKNSTTNYPVEITGISSTDGTDNAESTNLFLGSDSASAAQLPLMFLQNGYLKAMAQQVEVNNHPTAWALYMGFLYNKNFYSKAATYVGKINGVTLVEQGDYYWNLFPASGGSIEGYATVYCYFDRSNYSGQKDKDKPSTFTSVNGGDTAGNQSQNDSRYFDNWNGLEYRGSYEKDGSYVKTLNDPALKYNEAW